MSEPMAEADGMNHYLNGHYAVRLDALLAAMRTLPFKASADEIVAVADTLLYDRHGIFFDEHGKQHFDGKYLKKE